MNAAMSMSTLVTFKLIERERVNSVNEQLYTVLESRVTLLSGAYTIPADRNSRSLNKIMRPSERSLGETGETYIIERSGKKCRMASRSRFEEYNKTKGEFDCTTHWIAILNSGRSTQGEWIDYRGELVYGVGQRIVKSNKTGRKLYGIVVERDAKEVRKGIATLMWLSIIVLAGFMLGSAVACFIGYFMQKKEIRAALENKITLESVPSGNIRINKSGIITYVNPAMHKMFGYEEGEMVGQSVHIIIPDEYIADHDAGMKRYLESNESSIIGKQTRDRLTGLKKNGSKFPCSLTINEIKFTEGTQFAGVFVDMTAEHEAREKIERQNKSMKEIGYMFRHDVTNHITPIQMGARFLQSSGKYSDRAVDLIVKESGNAIRLLKSLSELSRQAESDMTELAVEDLDFKQLVLDVGVSGIDVIVEDMPHLECNAGLMQGAVRNIIENAQKYGPDDALIEVRRENGTILFVDNAGGFGCVDGVYDSDYAAELLKPRVRGDHDVPGTGLGLVNIKNAIEKHGWTFEHETFCGKGTTWIINIS